VANQDTPNLDGWPIAHPPGLGFLLQETPVPAAGVMSNDATSPPGGLPVPHGVELTGFFPSQGRG
jgi:hypothetical protein